MGDSSVHSIQSILFFAPAARPSGRSGGRALALEDGTFARNYRVRRYTRREVRGLLFVHGLRSLAFHSLAFAVEVPDARNGRPRLLRCGDAAVRLHASTTPATTKDGLDSSVCRQRRSWRRLNGGVAGASIGLTTPPRRTSDPSDSPRGLFWRAPRAASTSLGRSPKPPRAREKVRLPGSARLADQSERSTHLATQWERGVLTRQLELRALVAFLPAGIASRRVGRTPPRRARRARVPCY